MPSSKTIQWGATSLARVRDAGNFAVQQLKHLGKGSKSVPWFPYGYDASVPTNVLSVILGVLGLDSKVHLPGTPPAQVPEIEVGEVVVFHPTTGSKVHFLANGDVQVEAGLASVTIAAAAGSVTVNAPTGLTINGNVVVNGSITTVGGGVTIGTTLAVTGASTLGATVTAGGTNIGQTHAHSAGTYLDSVAAPVTGTSGTPI